MALSRITCAFSAVVLSLITLSSHASLAGRDLDGNLSTAEAYYDTVLDITWLGDANYAGTAMDWTTANSWAAGLDPYGSGITGWRLPETNPIDGTTADDATYSYTGSEDRGYNVSAPGTLYAGSTASEMAHLFYNTLGGVAFCNSTGCGIPNWGLSSTGPFSNIQPTRYWSATEYAPFTGFAWGFDMEGGGQNGFNENYSYYAWAVHDGDVGASVPTDSDNDGIYDNQDNCPHTSNANQLDFDNDGVGDVCDTDDDNDGMPDSYETSMGFNPLNPTDATADADGDGYTNLEEYKAGTDPHDPESFPRARFMPWLPLLLD